MGRIAALDGWRGCAIAAVLFGHFVTTGGLNAGRLGVELFFVLSGRLMAEMLFVRRVALPTFYLRRFGRVYPALLAYGVALFAVAAWRSGAHDAARYAAALTFTLNYAQIWLGRSTSLDHIWSLCVEEHMYLLLGLLALIQRRWRLAAVPVLGGLIALGVGVGAVQHVAGMPYEAVYWRSDVRGASILMGALAYLVWGPRRGMDSGLASGLGMLLAVAGCGLQANMVPDPLKYSVGTACLAMAVAMLRPGVGLARVLERGELGRLGVISYSLYLWQQPFTTLGGGRHALFLPVAGLVALGSFHLVEQPARRAINRLADAWGQRVGKRARTRAVDGDPAAPGLYSAG